MLCPLCWASRLPTYPMCHCCVYHGHGLCTALLAYHHCTGGCREQLPGPSVQPAPRQALRLPSASPRAPGWERCFTGCHTWPRAYLSHWQYHGHLAHRHESKSWHPPAGKAAASHTLHFFPWHVYISIIWHTFLFHLITRDIKRCILIYCLQKCTL